MKKKIILISLVVIFFAGFVFQSIQKNNIPSNSADASTTNNISSNDDFDETVDDFQESSKYVVIPDETNDSANQDTKDLIKTSPKPDAVSSASVIPKNNPDVRPSPNISPVKSPDAVTSASIAPDNKTDTITSPSTSTNDVLEDESYDRDEMEEDDD